MTKQWKVRVPYIWHDGQTKCLRFSVEAKNREQAKIIALGIAQKKCAVPPNILAMKMTRIYA